MILSSSVVISAFFTVAFAANGGIATKHNTTLCVVPQQKPANGVPVVLATCNGASSSWTFNTSGTNPMGTFQVTGTNQCLDVKNGVVANGTPLQTWECTPGDKYQQFVLINGTTIGWAGQSKCLDVKDGKFVPGTPLQIWDCTGGQNQQFVYPAPVPVSSFGSRTLRIPTIAFLQIRTLTVHRYEFSDALSRVVGGLTPILVAILLETTVDV